MDNYGRFNISDLNGKLKYSSKESREDWQLTRDAVHGELLKAIRAIDVMKSVAIDALKHSPPRTQAESLQRQREIQKQKQRSEQITDNLSSRRITRGGYSYSPSPKRESSTSASASASASTSLANNNNNNTRSSQHRAPSIPVSSRSTNNTQTAGKPSSSSSRSPNHQQTTTVSSTSNNNNNSKRQSSTSQARTTTSDTMMDIDPQLAFEAIAVSQAQLDEALQILKGDPMELERGQADGDAPPLKIIERSPAKTFYRHNDPDSPKNENNKYDGDASFASTAATASSRRG